MSPTTMSPKCYPITAEENSSIPSKNKINIDKLGRLHKPSSSKPYQIFIQ